MSEMLDRSKIEIKLGSYGTASATSLTDPLLQSRVQEYKRLVSGRMVPLDREAIRLKVPDSEYHASRKVDGEFTVLAYQDGMALTVNPGGTVRVGLPVIQEAAELLQQAGVSQALLACELYVEHGGRERIHDMTRVVRSPESEEQLQQVALQVFDIIEWNQATIEGGYAAVWQQIESTFSSGKRVKPVENTLVRNSNEIADLFEKVVGEKGAEGLVLRSDSAGMFKIKPRHSLDAVIIGFTESTGERAGMLHDLLVAVRRDDGTFHVLCRVGGGLSDDLRRSLLADLKDEVVSSEYAEVNSDHVTYEMVEPRIVIEISCLDLISQSTRGAPINRMTLDWDPEARIYRVLRRLPLVSVISPQFVQFRDDKNANRNDVRIEQVSAAVDVPMLDRDAKHMTLARSEILHREVFSKVLKGETMVRKFLLWKTNKEAVSSDFPAYVVHFTDYSPNRATPLSRDVRVSNSQTQAIARLEEMKEANIKKGWSPVGAAENSEKQDAPAEGTSEEATPKKAIPKKKTSKKSSTKKSPGKAAEDRAEDPEKGTPVKKTAKRKSAAKKVVGKKTTNKGATKEEAKSPSSKAKRSSKKNDSP